jgi:SAM-dependent methyltransferase
MKLCMHCRRGFEAEGWICPACGHSPASIDGFPSFAPALAEAGAAMPAGAHHRLDQLQEQSFWFRGRNRLIQDLVLRFFPDAGTLLEVGCGSGFVLAGLRAVLPAAQLVGSEIYVHGLGYAAKRVGPPCELLQMDARSIPYEAEFDVIGAFDVLEHIDEDEAVLKEIQRTLKPGGGVMLTVPQHPSLWSKADELACHRRRYRRRELADKLRRNGFVILRDTSFISLLLPAMLLQRLMAARSDDYDPERELALPGAIDRLFEATLDVERWLIRVGIDLPLGGSRVVVARKAP